MNYIAKTLVPLFAIVLLFKVGSVGSNRWRNPRDVFWDDLQRLAKCGVGPTKLKTKTGGARILNGEVVPDNEIWPWMVYIYIKRLGRLDGFICGGTLIHKQWVLTAAHCLQLYNNAKEYEVVLGENDINSENGYEKEAIISKIVVHPDFNRITLAHDLALMKLKRPIVYSDTIRPACLPPSGFQTDATEGDESFTGEGCTALGWGLTEFGRKSGNLRKVELTIMPRFLCMFFTGGRHAGLYQSAILSNSAQFCAVGMDGKDTCNGDSGGPLLCYNKDSRRYFIHGVTSYGPRGNCGQEALPAIYTQVSKYHDWIAKKMFQALQNE